MIHEPPAPRAHLRGDDADVVTAEWQRRTQAEYASAAIAHQVTFLLIQLGAPPDLIRDGLGVVEDELAHSELAAEVARAAGGDRLPPAIDRAALTPASPGDPLMALASWIVRFFCIGETVAVPLFRMLRERSSVPFSRRALDVVLRDEAKHRQFGWDVLDWLLLVGGEPVSDHVGNELPAMLDDVVAVYGGSRQQGQESLSPQTMAWGLAPPSEYATTLSIALSLEVIPRFAARGVTRT